MKAKWTIWVGFLALSIFLPLSEAADEPKEEIALQVKVQATETTRPEQPQPIRLPVYKPPRRGAPKGRVGGGTRGGPG